VITSSDCGRNNKLEVQSVQVETARRRGQSANVEILARRRGQSTNVEIARRRLQLVQVVIGWKPERLVKAKLAWMVKTGYSGYDDLNVKWGRVLSDTRHSQDGVKVSMSNTTALSVAVEVCGRSNAECERGDCDMHEGHMRKHDNVTLGREIDVTQHSHAHDCMGGAGVIVSKVVRHGNESVQEISAEEIIVL